MKNDRIKQNLDACLKDVHVSVALHNEIMQKASAPAAIRRIARPRKLIVAMALMVMLLITTAAAITIAELVRKEMEPVKQRSIEMVIRNSWLLEDKLYYVDLMEGMGFQLDQDKLALLRSGGCSEEEQEQLAGELIWDCLGEHMLSVHGVTVDPANEPEPYPIPNNEMLFEMLWLQNDPEAEMEEIHAAYDEWRMELHAALPADTPVPENMTEEQKYAALLNDVDAYMADVMSMSQKERAAAEIAAKKQTDRQAWDVVISVKGSDLRDVTREWFELKRLYGDASYDEETDTYSYPCAFRSY